MSSETATEHQLIAENAELRAQLSEAQEMLSAIRAGQVDALVIESASGPQVFTLQGLEAQSNRLRGEMLGQVSDAVIASDEDQRVTYLNAAAERLYGVFAKDVLGCRLSEMYESRWAHRDDEAAVIAALHAHGEWRGENTHVLRDGRVLNVESSVTILRDGSGAATGELAVIRDITDRKRAEETLRASESRLNSILNNLQACVYEMDIDSCFVHINQHFEALFNLKSGEVRGQSIYEVFPQEIAAAFEANNRRVLSERVPIEIEEIAPGPDGPHTYLSIKVPRFDDEGKAVGIVGISTDITARKQAEEALKEADRRKDEFLATLAHELRNPLAPIRNAVQLLRMQKSLDPNVAWARDVIDRQSQQMTRLVDDLLDLSRISRGTIELQRERIELSHVVQQAIETSRPLIESQADILTVDLPPEPIILDADLTRLSQVFMNLLTNAAKYTERGGRIALTAKREGDEVVVSVRDNGIGLPADKLSSIFEMFSQVEDALSRSQGGLGIGLSLVKQLVQMHGGAVEARSAGRNQGSEFIVRLPI
jgi:PAS domain S-box-containing protein